MNGIINIYKENGYTSHDVVAKLRGILKQKKIGHTGTLDPAALGVLPVCLGNATRVCELLTDREKTYVAVMKLGITTDTQDMTGKVLTEGSVEVTEETVRQSVLSFEGDYDQVPPMYSALKVNGKKLYELARAGREVERKPRPVHIYNIHINEINLNEQEVVFEVTCSKGTYIRTLCHDIGEMLGCGACMASLIRTKVGPFVIEESHTLGEVEAMVSRGRIEDIVLPVDRLFEAYPAFRVLPEAEKLLRNGNEMETAMGVLLQGGELGDGESIRIYDSNGTFQAIYRLDAGRGVIKPVKMFL
ncbi:tRNA pseudouridine(55) synthase TruB [Anaerolentibacter hominis]|uniref:tRNA pseudouridine(55) synthase TruB n=1 Tax=Anaerolentibacter hominis TaxID=3079009 RepID=UPI0031B823DC